ncbi:hypothetical protein [Caballeronia telluris]|uniref:Uncharacterized protein n=1 Tax=Caballeronia telluris TaxID=326475 RepID=A0A158JT11_9BURK|nr:hypothetical protein [Caballeronia telluris]SAL71177.1 hypothetical protein AWB66_04498 [Caballeronia telluris]SAL71579.1 hypothetical protein AWB66_04559 [Caballeronia telluris]
MNQVIVGVFASYRDGHEALRALQLAGLRRDDAQLYRAGQPGAPQIDEECLPTTDAHREDEAEYAAHGEHQGVVGGRNRFTAASARLPEPLPGNDDTAPVEYRGRTLLVIRLSDEIKPGAVGEMLHEHGAIAVKDASGHWRFSPYRGGSRTPR